MAKHVDRLQKLLADELNGKGVNVSQPSTSDAAAVAPVLPPQDAAPSFTPSTSDAAYGNASTSAAAYGNSSTSAAACGNIVRPPMTSPGSTSSTSCTAVAPPLQNPLPSVDFFFDSSTPSEMQLQQQPSKVSRKKKLTETEEKLVKKLEAYGDAVRPPITSSDSTSSASSKAPGPPLLQDSFDPSMPSTSAAAYGNVTQSTSAAAYAHPHYSFDPSAPSTSAAAYKRPSRPSKVSRKEKLTDSEEQLVIKLCQDIQDATDREKQRQYEASQGILVADAESEIQLVDRLCQDIQNATDAVNQRRNETDSHADLTAAANDTGSSSHSVFTAAYPRSEDEEDPWEWLSLSSSPSDRGRPSPWPDDELDDDLPPLARDENEDDEEVEGLHTLSEDPLISEDDMEDYYTMAHLSDDRQMLKELLYLFSASTCRFGDVTTDIKTWYLMYNTRAETVSYVLVGEASDGREFKRYFPDVYRNVRKLFTDNCHVYFTSRAQHGVAFEFVFVGSIPEMPEITGEYSSGRNQLSLIALARKAVFDSARNSIGAICSRSIKRMCPPQFWTNYFLPALSQNWYTFGDAIEGGPDQNKVLYGHIVKRSQQLATWTDERICLRDRLAIKKKLLRMFPTFVRVPVECPIIPLLLEYLSFGMVTYINE